MAAEGAKLIEQAGGSAIGRVNEDRRAGDPASVVDKLVDLTALPENEINGQVVKAEQ